MNPFYLEVGIEKVEAEQNRYQGWKRQWCHNCDQANCRQQAQKAPEPERSEVGNVPVYV